MTSTPTPKRQLANVGPIEQLRGGRLWRRIPQLLIGLYLFGASMAMMVNAGLGMMPWDVLNAGILRHMPVTFGTVVTLLSFVVLLIWIPLRQQPGIGTVLNALLIGPALDLTRLFLPEPDHLGWQIPLMLAGVALNGLASAMYIGSQFGPGPRDGLMTGLARVTGRSIRLVRTLIEVTVVAIGWPLGGVVGIGTVLYAVGIGPITQALLPTFTVELRPRQRR
ncbi:YczE/YyaS/YitT family protein [Brevibacterium sp. FAM 24630]|uniref:membrane protein YczE n=1 Tax=Brevibacterium sp. FAM 24630 TaxID=3415680 RepID=UPI003C798E31